MNWCPGGESNPHGLFSLGILRPTRMHRVKKAETGRSLKQTGEPGNRLSHLCIFPEGVGRVYFTIYFTVRGGWGTPPNRLGWDPNGGSLSVYPDTFFIASCGRGTPRGSGFNGSHLARVWDQSDPHTEGDLGRPYNCLNLIRLQDDGGGRHQHR